MRWNMEKLFLVMYCVQELFGNEVLDESCNNLLNISKGGAVLLKMISLIRIDF